MTDPVRRKPVPTLTAAEFLILAPLIGGRELPFADLRGEVDWQPGDAHGFLYAVRKLVAAGFLERRRIVVRVIERRRDEALQAVVATKAGENAWVEFVDWVTFTAGQVDGKANGKRFDVIRRERAHPVHRPPGDEERALILEAAHDELARFCRVLWGLPDTVTVRDLVAVDVDDFDAGTSQLRVDGRSIAVEGDAAAAVRQAIDGREAGPLFLNRAGKRWTQTIVAQSFAKLRRRLQLPRAVKLRGRNWKSGKRTRRRAAAGR